MDESRARNAIAQLESLYRDGRLPPADYRDRHDALSAVLPAGEGRRARLGAQPLWWFAASEVGCKLAIGAYAVLVG